MYMPIKVNVFIAQDINVSQENINNMFPLIFFSAKVGG
jgi:hypothetical protein